MKRALPLLLLAVASAWAGDHPERRTAPVNATYADECGSCHVAYPPAMLPAASWQRVMGDLAHHYGADASLDPRVAASLAVWLDANASRRRTEAPPEDRITRSRWFVREHDEVPASAWKRTRIQSPSNCTACHEGAARGDFDEHAVRIPR